VGSLVGGTYTGHVTITSSGLQGSPLSVPVTFTVNGPTPPHIVATASPAPNANGWNNSNVTVTFTCSAGTNPVQTCPSPVVVSAEGPNQVIAGTATDSTGLTATASVSVSLDKTPPTITAVPSPTPNAAGWNKGSVTVSFTTSDALSGVA